MKKRRAAGRQHAQISQAGYLKKTMGLTNGRRPTEAGRDNAPLDGAFRKEKVCRKIFFDRGDVYHLRYVRSENIEHETKVFTVMVLLIDHYLMSAVLRMDGILVISKLVYKIRRRACEKQHQRQ